MFIPNPILAWENNNEQNQRANPVSLRYSPIELNESGDMDGNTNISEVNNSAAIIPIDSSTFNLDYNGIEDDRAFCLSPDNDGDKKVFTNLDLERQDPARNILFQYKARVLYGYRK